MCVLWRVCALPSRRARPPQNQNSVFQKADFMYSRIRNGEPALVCAINWYAYICEPDYEKGVKIQGSDSGRAPVVWCSVRNQLRRPPSYDMNERKGAGVSRRRINERNRMNFTITRWRTIEGSDGRWARRQAGIQICHENLIDDV